MPRIYSRIKLQSEENIAFLVKFLSFLSCLQVFKRRKPIDRNETSLTKINTINATFLFKKRLGISIPKIYYTVPCHNKHIFVRQKKGVLIMRKVLISGSGGFRTLSIVYTV